MKFDFSNSRYVRMFEDSVEGRQIITYLLNDPNLIRSNYTFWKTCFPADLQTLKTDASGLAAVRISARPVAHATMADWRAPLGNSRLGEEGASQSYNAGIINLITEGWQEQAMEREYKEKLFEELGSDAPILLSYATEILQPRVDAINMSLSNMAAQALSTGEVIYRGGMSIKGPVYKSPVPAENFVKPTKVFTDPDCDILAEMAEIERHFREDVWGNENIALQWDIPYDMFMKVFLKNEKVIEYIKIGWLADKGQLINQTNSVPNSIITEDAFNKYVSGVYPGLSPINIIIEKQLDNGVTVQGWKEGVITLRPRGNAGKTYRAEILDRILNEKYGNSVIQKVFGTTYDGVITVAHTTGVNGQFKYWALDVMANATPILDVFMNMAIVDTTTAKD